MRRHRFWIVAGAVLALGLAADWWYFRRCPGAQSPEPLLYSAEWVDPPEARLRADGDGLVLQAPRPREDDWDAFAPSLRAVQLESVVSVNRLILRTEFGLEEVEIAGLGGPEAWLPEEANAYLRDVGRRQMEEHLRAAAVLYEVRLGEHHVPPWRTLGSYARFTWPARGWSGRRLVHLVADPERAAQDVGSAAVEAGWTYAAPLFARLDALHPPAVHLTAAEEPPGFHALPCFAGARAALEDSLAVWSALDAAELTRRGRAVAASFVSALPGLEPERLQFLVTDRDGLRGELQRLMLWMGGGTSPRDRHLQSCAEVEGTLAVSMPGGRIWVRADRPMPIELLDWVLGHEIIHQYQHLQERRRLEHGFPFRAYPDHLHEAHAEALNLHLQRQADPALPAAALGFAYEESVARVVEEAAALGRSLPEYLDEILRAHPEPVLGGIQHARPETMLVLHGGGPEWRGLSFAPRRGVDGNLEILVSNLGDAPIVTRFTGQWMARLRRPVREQVRTPDERYEVENALDFVRTGPFVLELGPRVAVTIQLGRGASWMDEWTAFLGCHDPIAQHAPNPR